MDFAENYHFVVQAAPQQFHWNNTQTSLQPVVIYYRPKEGSCDIVFTMSFVVIFNSLDDNTTAVFAFQEAILKHVKQDPPSIRYIHYFSNGAVAQYKNGKNFINLCHHEINFEISAEWNFFATPHGKSACDGVGGSMKGLAEKASLQKQHDNHVLTRQQLFKWTKENMAGIRTIWVSKTTVDETQLLLTERYMHAIPIKNTRKYHHFKPISKYAVRVGLTSYSEIKVIVISREH